jgi:hypothetical protein
MTNQQADLKETSRIGRMGALPHMLFDRARFAATPPCCAGEIIAMDVVDNRKETTSTGLAARSLSTCRVICSVDRLLSLLMAVLAALVLVGLLGTQALAHDGHGAVASAPAPGVEAVVSADDAPLSDGLLIMTADAASCDGHCCFTSLCCPAVAVALDVSPVRRHPATTAAPSAVDLIAAGPPEGPRRPPKPRI